MKELAKWGQELWARRHGSDAQLALGRSANRAVLRKLMEVEDRQNDRADAIRRDQFKAFVERYVPQDYFYDDQYDSKMINLGSDNDMETLAARFRSFPGGVVKHLLPNEDAASLV